jgi:hypothetical protein
MTNDLRVEAFRLVILSPFASLRINSAKNLMRPFTEPALREILQSLLSFRMTENEGFRMTMESKTRCLP